MVSRYIKQIEYRHGMLKGKMKPGDLPVQIWTEGVIPDSVREAIEIEDLIHLEGVHGDQDAGEPVQYQNLKLTLTERTVEITVFNLAIMLFFSEDERFRRIVRVLSKLEMPEKPLEKSVFRAQKIAWSGHLTAIQPRIRLNRSFDQRYHSYLGYVLRIDGESGSQSGQFWVAVGKAAHEKCRFQKGMTLSGMSEPVDDPRIETAQFYRTTQLKVVREAEIEPASPPPYHGIPPNLDIYRSRGHRRLQKSNYENKCTTCIWGCLMPVEIIVDHWNPSVKRYRFEAFCYGPKSCISYRAGATRKVPGRRGMTWEEDDWVDDEATAHREDDD